MEFDIIKAISVANKDVVFTLATRKSHFFVSIILK